MLVSRLIWNISTRLNQVCICNLPERHIEGCQMLLDVVRCCQMLSEFPNTRMLPFRNSSYRPSWKYSRRIDRRIFRIQIRNFPRGQRPQGMKMLRIVFSMYHGPQVVPQAQLSPLVGSLSLAEWGKIPGWNEVSSHFFFGMKPVPENFCRNES